MRQTNHRHRHWFCAIFADDDTCPGTQTALPSLPPGLPARHTSTQYVGWFEKDYQISVVFLLSCLTCWCFFFLLPVFFACTFLLHAPISASFIVMFPIFPGAFFPVPIFLTSNPSATVPGGSCVIVSNRTGLLPFEGFTLPVKTYRDQAGCFLLYLFSSVPDLVDPTLGGRNGKGG